MSTINLIWCILIILASIAIAVLPARTLSIITYPFSFKTVGIRRQKRLNNRTDSIGNLFLTVSLVFCIVYPAIPLFNLIFALWATFSWLCALSRVPRMSRVHSRKVRFLVALFLNLVFGFGLIGGLGIFNRQELVILSKNFYSDLLEGQVWNIMYPLTHAAIIAWLAQGLLMMIPLWFCWSQFKYMRVENSYRGRNIFTYSVKGILVLTATVFLGIAGAWGINKIYQVDALTPVNQIDASETEEDQEVVDEMEEIREEVESLPDGVEEDYELMENQTGE